MRYSLSLNWKAVALQLAFIQAGTAVVSQVFSSTKIGPVSKLQSQAEFPAFANTSTYGFQGTGNGLRLNFDASGRKETFGLSRGVSLVGG